MMPVITTKKEVHSYMHARLYITAAFALAGAV